MPLGIEGNGWGFGEVMKGKKEYERQKWVTKAGPELLVKIMKKARLCLVSSNTSAQGH